MCARLVCLLSFLLLPLVHLHLSSSLSRISLPLPTRSFHLLPSLLFLFFIIHPSPSHSDLLDATFPPFFSLTIKSSLVHLLTSFVAFTCSSAVGASLQFASARFLSSSPQLPHSTIATVSLSCTSKRGPPLLYNRFPVPLALITVCVRFHPVNERSAAGISLGSSASRYSPLHHQPLCSMFILEPVAIPLNAISLHVKQLVPRCEQRPRKSVAYFKEQLP